jgi:leucine dehydrogenase
MLEEKIVLDIERLPIPDYEQVLKVTDPASGLNAIIAIHNTTLGPALGGIRIQPYASFDDALEDVLRLSKGMTYKSSLVDVGLGGGKAVVIADPKTQKTQKMLLALGSIVEKIGGAYICAEDVGCTTEDVKIIRKTTRFVVGLPHSKSSGDPGLFTAWGVYRAIQATIKKLTGSNDVQGHTVAIQGLGNVGMNLAEYLFWAGAKLIVSDIDPAKLSYASMRFGAKTLPSSQILSAECDILAPCALGAILNDTTIPHLRCKAVVGGANNQLLKPHHADSLRARGILYAPDFVINVGGILNVADELNPDGYNASRAHAQVHRIYDTLMAIYEIADRNSESTHDAAIALAEHRIKNGVSKRMIPPTFHHTAE